MAGVVIWFAVVAFIVLRAMKNSNGQGKVQMHTPVAPPVQQQAPQQSVVEELQQKRARQQEVQKKRQEYMEKQKAKQQGEILARAKANAGAYAADTTLEELEESHGHSARVASTGVMEYQEQHRQEHPHDAAHVAAELDAQDGALLGKVEDLMVMGYDGKLPYERDFLGEGMDMIARFTLQPVTMNFEASKAGE